MKYNLFVMAIITLQEVFDIVIMMLGVGYIFMDIPLVLGRNAQGFSWKRLKAAVIVTAPAVVLHELAHKFVGAAVCLLTTFHAAYFWLGMGIVLKWLQSPIVFFVPGYVSIHCATMPCLVGPLETALTAFAGPAVNLVLWLGSAHLLKRKKYSYKKTVLLVVTQKINMFLFIFNMLPFPIFDGYKLYVGLYAWLMA